VDLQLLDFDHLVTKAKIEEEDDFMQLVNPNTRFETLAQGAGLLAEGVGAERLVSLQGVLAQMMAAVASSWVLRSAQPQVHSLPSPRVGCP